MLPRRGRPLPKAAETCPEAGEATPSKRGMPWCAQSGRCPRVAKAAEAPAAKLESKEALAQKQRRPWCSQNSGGPYP